MREKIPLYIIGAFVLFLLVTALAGCRTKSVTEYISVHDTLLVTRTDTLYKVKVEHSADTLRIETEKVVTVNVGGDTVKVVETRDRWRDRVMLRTDTIYQAKTDTIYRAKEAEKDRETVVTKRAWWERLGMFVAIIALCVGLSIAIKNRD